MRLAPLVLAAAGALSFAAAAYPGSSHNALDDGRPIPAAWSSTGNFDKVSAAGPDTVRFTTGDRWQVRAEGDARTLDRLRFLVEDGQLVVGRRSSEDKTKLPAATIYVTAPSIQAATLAGSGAFAVDRLSGEQVSATVAGISIQTIGLILFVIGIVWLVIELAVNRPRRAVATRERVVDRPVTREREVL